MKSSNNTIYYYELNDKHTTIIMTTQLLWTGIDGVGEHVYAESKDELGGEGGTRDPTFGLETY